MNNKNEKIKKSSWHGVWNLLFVSIATSSAIGGLQALIKVVRHGYLARNLPNVAYTLFREDIGLGAVRGVFAGLALIIFFALAKRIVRRRRRRMRSYAFTPLFIIGILILVSFIVTLTMRHNLAGPMAEHLSIRVVVLRAILPMVSDAATVPKSVLSFVSLILLTASFLLAAGMERLIFRKEPKETPSRQWGIIPGATAFGVLILLAVAYRLMAPEPHDVNAPDIIFISIDTLRADHLSSYGYHRRTSPNLDMLAEEGILVEQHISHSPWTLPTHISMFTGLMPFEHGVTTINRALSPRKLVITEYLKEKGYRTAAFVTNVLLSPTFGYGSGVDHYVFKADFPAGDILPRASRWFAKSRTPAFAFIHLYDPHYPYKPKQDVRGAFAKSSDGLDSIMAKPFFEFAKAAINFDEMQKQAVIDRYDEEILYVDTQLGIFFNKLRAMGRYRDAWIIVTSDHGEEFADHGLWGHSITLFEEMLRVPLIIKPPGEACRDYRLQGSPIPQKALFNLMTNASVLPEFEKADLSCKDGKPPQFLEKLIATDGILAESEAFAPHRFAIRKDGMKLIEPFEFSLEHFEVRRDWELYDLKTDPGEQQNIYVPDAAPDIAKIIESANAERENASADSFRQADVSDQQKGNLKALGYLQ
jgi:Sulfatase